MEHAKAILEVFKASETRLAPAPTIDDKLTRVTLIRLSQIYLLRVHQAKAILEGFKASSSTAPGAVEIDDKLPQRIKIIVTLLGSVIDNKLPQKISVPGTLALEAILEVFKASKASGARRLINDDLPHRISIIGGF